jgi:hypothetical protein
MDFQYPISNIQANESHLFNCGERANKDSSIWIIEYIIYLREQRDVHWNNYNRQSIELHRLKSELKKIKWEDWKDWRDNNGGKR